MSNQIFNKTTKDRYVATSNKTIAILSKLACLKCWHLYFYLAEKQSFQNGICGVFSQMTIYELAKILHTQLKIELNTTKTKRLLQKLEKVQLIKVINEKPLILILTTAEQAEDLKTLDEVLDYVKHNEIEFFFNVQHKRAKEFFDTFKIDRLPATPGTPPGTQAKGQALDTLIHNRPTRATPPTAEQVQEAKEWARVIQEEDPFKNHLLKNKKHITQDYEKCTDLI